MQEAVWLNSAMPNRLKSTLIVLFLFFLLFGQLTGLARSETLPSDTVAIVDGEPVTVEAFKAKMADRSGKFSTPQEKEALLDEMINFELLFGAAQRAGYDKNPEVLESLKRLMVNKYRKDMLDPSLAKISVLDKEIEDYYQNHETDFVTPKMVRAAIIRIAVPFNASEEKKAKLLQRAETARAEALKLGPAASSFGPVAVKYSDHQPTRYRGGDTGMIQADGAELRWPKEVMEAVFSLSEPRKVSPVITASDGYYLIKLMESKESASRPFAAVKERIRHHLLTEKRALAERKFYKELKGKIPVRVDRTRLEAIEPPGALKSEFRQPPALPGQ